jgi:hypothetical protein
MTKDQYLGFQRGPRPEQSDQRQPDQAASFSHKAEALRDSASVASRIRFPTGTGGVEMARKGGVPAQRVLNAMPLQKLLAHLAKRKRAFKRKTTLRALVRAAAGH